VFVETQDDWLIDIGDLREKVRESGAGFCCYLVCEDLSAARMSSTMFVENPIPVQYPDPPVIP
jgi:hypothetical protein